MHTLRLKLETNKREEDIINKRFYAISHIHNVVVKHAKKLLLTLEHDRQYQSYLTEYRELLKKEKFSKETKNSEDKNFSKEDLKRKKELNVLMKQTRIDLGLSKYGFASYIKTCAKKYRKLVSSHQVEKEAFRVWESVEEYLFGNGKKINFKKYMDFKTIGGKSNYNGVIFDRNKFSISWIGLNINCKLPKNYESFNYVFESLEDKRDTEEEKESDLISFCEIERKMFPNGWHYYVVVYIKGPAPEKLKLNKNATTNTTGIDIGTSTIATVSDNKVLLRELAPRCKEYNKKIERLTRSLELSRKNSNPDKYNPDGTIRRRTKEEKKLNPWVYYKSYYKRQNKLKSLYRQKSAYIKQCHEELCNELILNSTTFIVEKMNFSALQKRAKTTERSEKETEIKQKDGTSKVVKKFKKKKRFGKSLNNRAPAMLLTILERKCLQYRGVLFRVNTQTFKASQYNHITDSYEKTNLKDRSKVVDGQYVQRDLYSAFLLKNSNIELTAPDRNKCLAGFSDFLKLQEELVTEMKTNNISMRQCFGF